MKLSGPLKEFESANLFFFLKGYCHDIVISIEQAINASRRSKPTNNGLVLLPKTMLLHWNCLVPSAALLAMVQMD